MDSAGTVQDLVMRLVDDSEHGLKPTEIISKASRDRQEVRRAVEALIDSGKLEVTVDLKVVRPES